MTTLIVTAHPDENSLTHAVARSLAEQLAGEVREVAHLAQEDFDPSFTLEDRALYRGTGEQPASVTREQERLDRVTDIVLVFPVYWWSMPALLKGWIDRVFIAGWAFDYDDGRIRRRLQHLTMHLIPVSGTDEESFARHGYRTSFSTQIEAGIIGFCGMAAGVTAFIHDSESSDVRATDARVLSATHQVAAAILQRPQSPTS
jgi:NAD(P)H dehydrogenase (quinone)